MVWSDDIKNRFGYHPPRSQKRVQDHDSVRKILEDAALQLNLIVPDGREQSLMLTALEEAMFWANAGVARAPDPDAEVTAADAAAGPKE